MFLLFVTLTYCSLKQKSTLLTEPGGALLFLGKFWLIFTQISACHLWLSEISAIVYDYLQSRIYYAS